ncbi:DeoR/GlpR family DNA-binding transcription regulator [Lentibacillus sp. CBA3610]|uniref:DeoR/GlpR family DNA-binding transcription regulator n=1 Tax=Lentibacillus sp. CBA3610 TaxID=2518176 RepID=UPI001595CE02|nr:DeoR/GlpR family DNA-binding transcription regulator [Lentibacillus sp. CBA3610]QKY70102.1 DeoR/GlpR transcriptional regulator [Lentibacillus sp. CBA3610]
MLTEERHNLILKLLKQDGIVKSQHLMDVVGCSESTVRRDLDQLEDAGELTRIHGGAKRSYQLDEELTASEKSFKNVQSKEAIGKLAADLVENNDVIFIDAGTTTLAMIAYLQDKQITVVTNGIQHASRLADQGIETFLTGGKIKLSTKAIIGSQSLNELRNYRFDKAFLGMNGIDLSFGCTTPDPEEAALKQMAHQRAASAYLLADQSKWNKVTFANVCELEDVTIVTDRLSDLSQHYREKTTIMEAAK